MTTVDSSVVKIAITLYCWPSEGWQLPPPLVFERLRVAIRDLIRSVLKSRTIVLQRPPEQGDERSFCVRLWW